MQNKEYIIDKLKKLSDLLKTGKQNSFEKKIALLVDQLINIDEEGITQFGIADEIWGGSGSLWDQGFIDDRAKEFELSKLMIDIGEYYINNISEYNIRLEMRVDSYKNRISHL